MTENAVLDSALVGHYANLLQHIRGMVDALCPYDKDARDYFPDRVGFAYSTEVNGAPVSYGLFLKDLAPNDVHLKHPEGKIIAEAGTSILLDSLYRAALFAEMKLEHLLTQLTLVHMGEDFAQRIEKESEQITEQRAERFSAFAKTKHFAQSAEEDTSSKEYIARWQQRCAKRDAETLKQLAKVFGHKQAQEGENNEPETERRDDQGGRETNQSGAQAPEDAS